MSYEPLIGQIAIYPYNYAPVGWLRCDGQLLSIAGNTVLYALLGTRFGGDGTSNFALPDMRIEGTNGQHRNLPTLSSPPSLGYHIATEGLWPGEGAYPSISPYLGELTIQTTSYNLDSVLECRGQLLPIDTYEALYLLLGTTHGGDGINTFALPDMRTNIPVPGAPEGVVYHKGFVGLPYVRYHIALQGIYPFPN